MSGKYVDIDMSEFKEFFGSLERAAKGEFRKELELFLEGVGFDFLRVVQDEIVRKKVMDTRLLLASFEKGSDGNVWELTDGGLTLEIGTNVEYAKYVNDGHWTNPKGVSQRFVPGDVEFGEDGKIIKFTYNPAAKSGMMLKQHWVEGKHYFDSALRIFNKIFKASAEVKVQEWLDRYFGG